MSRKNPSANDVVRVGRVSAVYPERGTVAVEFPDREHLVSKELAVSQMNTKENADEVHLDVGEKVVCAFYGNGLAEGVVLGCIYDTKNPPRIRDGEQRTVTFQDGTRVSHHRKTHEMKTSISKAPEDRPGVIVRSLANGLHDGFSKHLNAVRSEGHVSVGSPELDMDIEKTPVISIQGKVLVDVQSDKSVHITAKEALYIEAPDIYFRGRVWDNNKEYRAPARTVLRFWTDVPLEIPVSIPKGTPASGGSVVFDTDVETEILPGELEAFAPATCTVLGEVGNGFLPGEIEGRFSHDIRIRNMTETRGGAGGGG